jgi:hypothetical protein
VSIPIERVREVIAELEGYEQEAEEKAKMAFDEFDVGRMAGRANAYLTAIGLLERLVNEYETNPKGGEHAAESK